MKHAIEVSNISKSFKNIQVLNQLNMHVPVGSVYGFLGNNGAGKSTLIRILMGLIKQQSGEFSILGTKGVTLHSKQKIGCIIDSPCLYANLTIDEFLSLSCTLKQYPKTQINRVLEIVSLTGSRSRLISQCSLGMKQRTALANALLGEPQLLILDEPTNGLDPEGMEEIRELIRWLPSQMIVSVLVSSHLLDEVEKMATHVGVLKDGGLVLEGELSKLCKNAQSDLSVCINSPKKAIKILNQKFGHKLEVVLTSDGLKVKNIELTEAPPIHRILVNSGIDIFQSRYCTPSLETIFHQQHKD
ncbi:ATP-binding cassette domain-containing protein [Parashewanella spongiae]|nr:ATP-binding cassette domain-containing protein [Parashewanella spongiae]MCL1079934.1 ATP-binding cassette domain-containing protein [Parashewanella spongiae]